MLRSARFKLSTLFVVVTLAAIASEIARTIVGRGASPFFAAVGLTCYAVLSILLVTALVLALVNQVAASVAAIVASTVGVSLIAWTAHSLDIVPLFALAIVVHLVLLLLGIWREAGDAPSEMHLRLLQAKRRLRSTFTGEQAIAAAPTKRERLRCVLLLALALPLAVGAYYGAYLMLCQPTWSYNRQLLEPHYGLGEPVASYVFYPAHWAERELIWPNRWHAR